MFCIFLERIDKAFVPIKKTPLITTCVGKSWMKRYPAYYAHRRCMYMCLYVTYSIYSMPSCAQRLHTHHFGMVGHEINNLSRLAFHKYVSIIAATTQKMLLFVHMKNVHTWESIRQTTCASRHAEIRTEYYVLVLKRLVWQNHMYWDGSWFWFLENNCTVKLAHEFTNIQVWRWVQNWMKMFILQPFCLVFWS